MNFREPVFNTFARRGIKIKLICPENREYTPTEKNVSVEPIYLSRSGMNPIADFIYFCKLVKLYIKEKPDYVFHYTIKPNIYGTLAAKLVGIPSTAMIAGLGYVFSNDGFRSRIGRVLYKFALRFSERILVLNQYNYDFVISEGIARKDQVILLKGGEGVDLNRFRIDCKDEVSNDSPVVVRQGV